MIEKRVWGTIISDYLEWDISLVEREKEYELPKVSRALAVIGPRRAGKTYFLFQIIHDILKKGVEKERTLYVNFEDPRLVGAELDDLMTMLEVYYSMFPENAKRVCHFFLDEVQNVEGWERFVRFLLDGGHKVIVSGSSARLLSKEVATELRGRGIKLMMYPFSFRELLKANEIDVKQFYSTYENAKITQLLQDYLFWGGYPEVVLNPSLRRAILKEIIDSTIYRDIVERWHVMNLKALRLLFKMLVFSSHLTISKAYKNMRSLGISVGKETLANYLSYLEDSLVFYPLYPAVKSYKLREMMGFKPYVVDNGLAYVLGLEDRGILFENLVFSELLKRGAEPNENLFYYVTRDKGEVDFLLSNEKLIQVSYELNEKNKEREIKTLVKAGNELGVDDLTVITWGQKGKMQIKGRTVKVVPIREWLLGQSI